MTIEELLQKYNEKRKTITDHLGKIESSQANTIIQEMLKEGLKEGLILPTKGKSVEEQLKILDEWKY